MQLLHLVLLLIHFGSYTLDPEFKKWDAYTRHNFQGKSFPIPEDIWNKLDHMASENNPEYPGYRKLLSIPESLPANVAPIIPEEVDENVPLYEGAVKRIQVNAYERNDAARKKCLLHYGCRCAACHIKLSDIYGEIAQARIHVHHLKPLSEINLEYQIDPIADLRPICPNCHDIIHLKSPPYSIEEMQELIKSQPRVV